MVVYGAADGTAATLASGATFLSDPIPVPDGAGSVSFEIRGTPSGTATLAVKVRGGNREGATLTDRGVTSPSALVSFATAKTAVVSAPADCRWVQLEIACSGANVALAVYATSSGGAAGVTSSVSGSVTVASGAITETNSGAIKTATEALSALISAGLFAVGGSVLVAIKTAVEALSALISAGKLATAATLQAGTAAIGKLTTNTGVDIGDVGAKPGTAIAGDTGTVGTAATRWDSANSHACSQGVWITNTHATQILYVGGSNTDTTHFLRALYPGEWVFLPLNNTNLVYLYGSGASTTYAIGYI